MEKAEALLRRSLEQKEDFWEPHFELGRLLEKKRDYAGAQKHLLRSIELNPEDSRPHYRLARVYTRLSNTEEAQREKELHAKLVEKEREAMRQVTAGSNGSDLVVE